MAHAETKVSYILNFRLVGDTVFLFLVFYEQCSIDALLEKTIKHMLFLQSVAKHADKLKEAGEPKVLNFMAPLFDEIILVNIKVYEHQGSLVYYIHRVVPILFIISQIVASLKKNANYIIVH